MVARNKVFSTPRRDANTFPSPPNVEPSPVPRCCNKIAATSSTESTIYIIPRICVSGINCYYECTNTVRNIRMENFGLIRTFVNYSYIRSIKG